MVNWQIFHQIRSQHPMPQLTGGGEGTAPDVDPVGCHSEVLLHAPGMPKIAGEGGLGVLLDREVPLAKNPSTGTAQQRLFLVLKVILDAVVVISEVLRLSTKSRCSRCCRAHLYFQVLSSCSLFTTSSYKVVT